MCVQETQKAPVFLFRLLQRAAEVVTQPGSWPLATQKLWMFLHSQSPPKVHHAHPGKCHGSRATPPVWPRCTRSQGDVLRTIFRGSRRNYGDGYVASGFNVLVLYSVKLYFCLRNPRQSHSNLESCNKGQWQ